MIDAPKLDLTAMRGAAARACGMLKVLGNPDRLMLLCQLTQGEYCVSELETLLGIQQPTLSQQLGVLREEGLVSTRREGKQSYYKIDSKEAAAIMAVLYELFCQPGKGEQKCVSTGSTSHHGRRWPGPADWPGRRHLRAL